MGDSAGSAGFRIQTHSPTSAGGCSSEMHEHFKIVYMGMYEHELNLFRHFPLKIYNFILNSSKGSSIIFYMFVSSYNFELVLVDNHTLQFYRS